MSAFEIVNWGEVVLWPTFGVACLVYALKKGSGADRILWILAPTFVLFGVSDFIELRTGAWWRPLGLLLLKAACIAVFLTAAFRHYRKSQSKTAENGSAIPDCESEDRALGSINGANKASRTKP